MADSTRDARMIAGELARLNARVRKMERSAQAANTSIESGSIDVYDDDELVQQIGIDEGGEPIVEPVAGVAPPVPTAPAVEAGVGMLSVNWSGVFVDVDEDDDSPAPPASVRLHVTEVLGEGPQPGNLVSVLAVAGGLVPVPVSEGVEADVHLVAVSSSGVESAPSATVTVAALEKPDPTDGEPPASSPAVVVKSGIGCVYLRVAEPVPNRDFVFYDYYGDGELLVPDGGMLMTATHRADGVTKLPDDTDTVFHIVARDADGAAAPGPSASGRPASVEVENLAQTILDIIAAAGAEGTEAQTRADEAIAAADAANAAAIAAATAAATAQSTADGAIRTHYQATAPAGLNDTTDLGDLWFDTDDNQAYRWGGTGPGWVIIEDNTISVALANAAAAQAAANTAIANAATAQTTADGKNKSITSTSAAPTTGLAAYVTGDIWWQRSGELIVGQWEFRGGAFVAKTLDNAVIANLNAAKLTAGFLDAARIAANSISADKVLVGSLDNLLPDPFFRGPFPGAWYGAVASVWSATGGRQNLSCVVHTGSPSYEFSPAVRVEPGGAYRIGYSYKTSGIHPANNLQLFYYWYDTAGAQISADIAMMNPAATVAGAWAKGSATITAPAGAVAMRVAPVTYGATVVIDEVFINRAANGQLIVDGSVTALKVAAEAITTLKLAAGAVTAEKVATDVMVTNEFYARDAYLGAVAAGQVAADFLSVRQAEIIDLFVERLRSEVNEVGDSMVFDGPESTITVWKDSTRNDVLFQVGPSGAINRVPMDTDGISAMGAVILKSADSRLDPGAAMTVSAGGVPDPSQPALLSAGTKPVATWPAVPSGFRNRGISWDAVDGCWIRLLVSTSSDITGKCRVEKIDSSGASIDFVTLGNIIGQSEDDMNSVVRVGTSYYVASYDSTDSRGWAIVKFAAGTGAFQVMSPHTSGITGRVAVGVNAAQTAVYKAEVFSGDLRLVYYNATDLTGAGFSTALSGWSESTSIMGVIEASSGMFGFTPTSLQVAIITAGKVVALNYAFGTNSFTRQTAHDITLDADVVQGGAGFRPGFGWHSLPAATRTLGRYCTYLNPGTDKAWVTFADRSAGGQTTKDSAPASLLVPNHRWVVIDLPNPAAAATEQWAYMGLGATLPADADLKHRTEPQVGRRLYVDPSAPGGAAVPSANTFPGGSPGVWKSEAVDGWEGSGDGTFKVKTAVLASHAVNKGQLDGVWASPGSVTNYSTPASPSTDQLVAKVSAGLALMAGVLTRTGSSLSAGATQTTAGLIAVGMRPRRQYVRTGVYGSASNTITLVVETNGDFKITPTNAQGIGGTVTLPPDFAWQRA